MTTIKSGDKHKHIFQYPFASCRLCGEVLETGDYTVAYITGNWKIKEAPYDH